MRETIQKHLSWNDAKNPFWLIGQDIGIAAGLARKYGTVGSIVRAFKTAVNEHIEAAKKTDILQKDSPLAQSHGTH